VAIWPNWSEFGIDLLDSIPTIAENRPNQTNLAVFTPLGAYWAYRERFSACAKTLQAPGGNMGSVPSFRTRAYNGRLRLTKIAVLVHSVDMTTTSWAIERPLMGRRT
jgi:hypothetical protein